MVELIAVDMDGTFLSTDKKYDQERFKEIFDELTKRAIKFVVASGNQYAQLVSFFPEISEEIAFVAENGMLVFDKGQLIHEKHFAKETVQDVIRYLRQDHPETQMVINGIKSAYLEYDVPAQFEAIVKFYCPALQRVDDLLQLDFEKEQYVKFAVSVPEEQIFTIIEEITASFPGKVWPVASGHGNIDLILPDSHKAKGLQVLSNRWSIAPENMMAFGDGHNDIEMLKYVGHSYAMANGDDKVKAAAKYLAPHNDDHGVLQVLESFLAR